MQSETPTIATTTYRNEKLKMKGNLSVFGKPYSAMAGSTTAREPYRQALDDHVMRSAAEIEVIVTDFNFRNLCAYLTAVAKGNRLEDFAMCPADGWGTLATPRMLRIFYHTRPKLFPVASTRSCPSFNSSTAS